MNSSVCLQHLKDWDTGWMHIRGHRPTKAMRHQIATSGIFGPKTELQVTLSPQDFDATWNSGFVELLKKAFELSRKYPHQLTVVTVSRAESTHSEAFK
jgi:hypothetical protein